MISKEDIQLLCNYTESATPISSSSKIHYLEYFDDNDEEYLREIKMKNRGLAINAVLEDKIEEYNNRETIYNPSYSSTGVMGLKVYSLGMSPNPHLFSSYDEMWDRTISHIESSTQNPHPFLTTHGINNFQYTKDVTKSDSDNLHSLNRKLISRIVSISSMIASSLSRRGPATFALVGKDTLTYMDILSQYMTSQINTSNSDILGNLNGITIIKSDKIKPNKIIIGRSESNQDGGGLMVLNDMYRYHMLETPKTFYKKFAWFEII